MANDFLNEDSNVSEEGFAGNLGKKLKWMGKTLDTFAGDTFGGESNYLGQIKDPLNAGGSVIGAGLVAAGAGLEVIDQLQHGNLRKAVKLSVTGAVEAAVTFLNGTTLGLANIASLAFTGSYIATNAAKVTGAALDALDGNINKKTLTSANAAVAFPGMAGPAMPAGAPAGVYGPQTQRLVAAGYGQRAGQNAVWGNSLQYGQNSVTQGV